MRAAPRRRHRGVLLAQSLDSCFAVERLAAGAALGNEAAQYFVVDRKESVVVLSPLHDQISVSRMAT